MMGLNVASYYAHTIGEKVDIVFHWSMTDPYKVYHFDDPETIMDRLNYVLPMYAGVNEYIGDIHHEINSRPVSLRNDVTTPISPKRTAGCNDWLFDPRTAKERDPDKVVVWRPKNNAEIPRKWKMLVDDVGWEQIILYLRANGFDVVELDYRTPISEAVWHITTCAFTFSYDGMWHYVAKNSFTPMVVVSRSAITKKHTSHALMVSEVNNNAIKFAKYIHFPRKTRYGVVDGLTYLQTRTAKYREQVLSWYNQT